MNNLSILPNDNIAGDPPAPPSPPAPPRRANYPSQTYQNVRVVDIEMGFGSMVVFMIKWAFASIPAVIAIFAIFMLIFVGLGGGAAILAALAGSVAK